MLLSIAITGGFRPELIFCRFVFGHEVWRPRYEDDSPLLLNDAVAAASMADGRSKAVSSA